MQPILTIDQFIAKYGSIALNFAMIIFLNEHIPTLSSDEARMFLSGEFELWNRSFTNLIGT
jgi:hypothetical protein